MDTQTPPRYLPLLSELETEADIQLVTKILNILDSAERSLTDEELIETLAVDVNRRLLNPDSETIASKVQEIRAGASGLLQNTTTAPVGQEKPYWDQLRHEICVDVVSVAVPDVDRQESSASEATWRQRGQVGMARICLVYLILVEEASGVSQSDAQFPFRYYAARHWSAHARSAESSTDKFLVELEVSFLQSAAYVQNWLQLYDEEEEKLRAASVPRRYDWVPAHRSPLYHAAFHGLDRATMLILSNSQRGGPDVPTSPDVQEAVYAASFRGHTSILLNLLAHGASPNADYGPFDGPLVAAAAGGHVDVVTVLLEHDAHLPDDDGDLEASHPLIVAAVSGYKHVVEVLARALDSVHNGRRALHYALWSVVERTAKSNRDEMIHTLLQLGANPLELCQGDVDTMTALETVIRRGSHISTHMMIKACDPEQMAAVKQQYMELAAAAGNADAVLEINNKSGQGETGDDSAALEDKARLISAAKAGGVETMRSLLDAMPDIWQEARDLDGHNLLQIAVRQSNTEVLDLLLQHVTGVSSQLWTPDAMRSISLDATRLASVDTARLLAKYSTPFTTEHLHVALRRGGSQRADMIRVVLSVLQHGSDINLRNELGRTPLHSIVAAHHYNEDELTEWAQEVLIGLLRLHPNLEERDRNERTALHGAVAMGNVAMVNILLDSGADPATVVDDEIAERRFPYVEDIRTCKRLIEGRELKEENAE